MKRRITALILAVMLTAALVINVSAKTSKYVDVGGVEYYCSTTCYSTSGYGTTQTMDDSVTVGVLVEVYDQKGILRMDSELYDRTLSASVTVQYGLLLSYTKTYHKANGSTFTTTTDYYSS